MIASRPLTVPIRAVIIASQALLCACVVPHSVDPEVQVFEEVRPAEDVRVSLGPKSVLDDLAQQIEKLDRRIRVVDGLTFRDTAYPEGGWRLSDLVDSSERRDTVAAKLGVDYLVLLGPGKTRTSDEKGEILVIVPSGIKGTETSRISAVIFDLASGQALSRLDVEASGTYRVGTYLIYMVGTDPKTQAASLRGLSTGISEQLRKVAGEQPIRIAILAAESKTEPFRSPTPAVPPVGQDPDSLAGSDGEQTDYWRKSLGLYEGLEERDGFYYEGAAAEPYTGTRATFYLDGQPAAELHFADGLEHGTYTIWNENGDRQRLTHYENGQLNGQDVVWFDNGRKRSESYYKAGRLHGVWTTWTRRGSVKSQACYFDGALLNRSPEDCEWTRQAMP